MDPVEVVVVLIVCMLGPALVLFLINKKGVAPKDDARKSDLEK